MRYLLPGFLLLGGCVPIPWPRTVVHPACDFQIGDEEGAPLSDVEVHFYHWTLPYGYFREGSAYRTDPGGRVEIAGRKETEWIFPLMMHGIPEHHWSYCAEKDGHGTVVGEIYGSAPGKAILVTIRMKQGERTRLSEDFERVYLELLRTERAPNASQTSPLDVAPLTP